MIDPAWEGSVQFYELVFGTWLAYIFLVVLWGKILRAPLQEWRYVLLNFFGAGAFWINHYFQGAPFYMSLLNSYTVIFLFLWYVVAVRGHDRTMLWQIGATLTAIVYTVAFIGFENIARLGVNDLGYAEFWFMLVAYFGFVGIIIWRGKSTGHAPAETAQKKAR
jgi:hypothetical protein